MKLKILKDHTHWHGPARCSDFKAKSEVDVPSEVAEKLLELDGVAERVAPAAKSAKKEG